jgi:uncharacterized protein YegL
MGFLDKVVEVPRRSMVLFFVVDTSGSMSGAKIGTVNTAIENVLPELKDISEGNADAQIKIAALRFSSGAEWIYDAPIEAETFRWNYVDAGGVTDLGAACEKLNEKLSRKAFMSDVTGSFAPAIFLMSDGEPTDNYQRGLDKLKNNNWFKKAIKVALAIGNDANKRVLEEFTGNSEAVLVAHTPEALRSMIRFVSVRASEIGSKSSNVGSSYTSGAGVSLSSDSADGVEAKQGDMINAIKTEAADGGWGNSADADQW